MQVHVVAFRHKVPGEGVGGFEWDTQPGAARERIDAIGVFADANYETFEHTFETDLTLTERDAITDWLDVEVWDAWARGPEYRDATYSVITQEHLRALLARLTSQDGWNEDEGVHALAEVISEWDNNEATATFTPEW